ncbi:Disease resistance protein RPS2 [Rhynchospora pubera]|uniref:Disease resistance protein RPS2 n=1 Tax=Rhynchospora pubera TaxID=906938 RepID=A0AAV8GZL9_9POAL|nr:Disease resistance protein RPS2 [Rhynchospora pubera]
MESAAPAVAPIISPLVSPIIKHVTYPFKVADNVKALETATENLVAVRDDVLIKVEIAERQDQTKTNQVQRWMNQVKIAIEEANKLHDKYCNRFLCVGGYSLNCWSNYSISKGADKKLLEVQNLYEEGKNFKEVALEKHPPVRELPIASSILPEVDTNFQQTKDYIENDDVGIIGIWGMGGVGKTHLLRRINNSYKENSTFDVVIYVTASKECSARIIQSRITEKLSLANRKDVDLQASIICDYLNKRNFLFLLDDVWGRIDLEAVGIPYPLGIADQYKRKVVITTRSEDICGQMEARKEIKISGLNEKEAWCLFEEKVGKDTLSSNPVVASLAKIVVDELEGLPLALITIGWAMRAKRQPKEWENAISLLQRSQLPEVETVSAQESLFYRLKFSYDSLKNDTLRQCFLAFSLWPEDKDIGKWELIHQWIGLGILEEPDMPSIERASYAIIRNLKAACLLEDGSDPDEVKMHDVIRDMALWIACDSGKNKNKWVVKGTNGIVESNVWYQSEKVALWDCGDDSIARPNTTVRQPSALTTLILNSSPNSLPDLQSFSRLTYLDLTGCKLSEPPSEIFGIISLVHLDLSENEIERFPEKLSFLTNLKYLYLLSNPFRKVPWGVISNLKIIHVLSLSDIGNGNALSYAPQFFDELNNLSELKALDIDVTDQEQFERLLLLNIPIRFLEIKYLNGIPLLIISDNFFEKTNIRMNLREMNFVELYSVQKIEFQSANQNPNWELHELESIAFLEMMRLKEVVWDKIVPENLLVRLRKMNVQSCPKLKSISWVVRLPQLEELYVGYCKSMEQIITEDGNHREEQNEPPAPTFPCLKSLVLQELKNLRNICSASITFPNLEKLHIVNCPQLIKGD